MSGPLELTIPAKPSVAVETTPDVDSLDTAKPLAEIFQPFQAVLEKWEAKASALVVTDMSQKTEMAQARLARLELKEARVNMDKTRKKMVEGLKARTGKIDGVARTIREKLEALEEQLRASEEFAERHAAQQKAQLKVAREAELLPFVETPILGDLSDLSTEAYAKTLADAKLLKQAKLDAIAKAEADRKAKEEADRIERERIIAENAKIKAEAAEAARLAEVERQRIEAERAEERRKAQEEAARIEAERKEERRKADAEAARVAEIARKEREAIEAKAKAEAEKAAKEAAKLKAELEAKAKAEAAEKARIAKEEAARAESLRVAAAAPDKAKLKAFAAVIRGLEAPALNNKDVQIQLSEQTEEFAVWIESRIREL
jgi:hypothetical protein